MCVGVGMGGVYVGESGNGRGVCMWVGVGGVLGCVGGSEWDIGDSGPLIVSHVWKVSVEVVSMQSLQIEVE